MTSFRTSLVAAAMALSAPFALAAVQPATIDIYYSWSFSEGITQTTLKQSIFFDDELNFSHEASYLDTSPDFTYQFNGATATQSANLVAQTLENHLSQAPGAGTQILEFTNIGYDTHGHSGTATLNVQLQMHIPDNSTDAKLAGALEALLLGENQHYSNFKNISSGEYDFSDSWVFDLPAQISGSTTTTGTLQLATYPVLRLAAPIPEPDTWALLGLGVVGLTARYCRRKKRTGHYNVA